MEQTTVHTKAPSQKDASPATSQPASPQQQQQTQQQQQQQQQNQQQQQQLQQQQLQQQQQQQVVLSLAADVRSVITSQRHVRTITTAGRITTGHVLDEEEDYEDNQQQQHQQHQQHCVEEQKVPGTPPQEERQHGRSPPQQHLRQQHAVSPAGEAPHSRQSSPATHLQEVAHHSPQFYQEPHHKPPPPPLPHVRYSTAAAVSQLQQPRYTPPTPHHQLVYTTVAMPERAYQQHSSPPPLMAINSLHHSGGHAVAAPPQRYAAVARPQQRYASPSAEQQRYATPPTMHVYQAQGMTPPPPLEQIDHPQVASFGDAVTIKFEDGDMAHLQHLKEAAAMAVQDGGELVAAHHHRMPPPPQSEAVSTTYTTLETVTLTNAPTTPYHGTYSDAHHYQLLPAAGETSSSTSTSTYPVSVVGKQPGPGGGGDLYTLCPSPMGSKQVVLSGSPDATLVYMKSDPTLASSLKPPPTAQQILYGHYDQQAPGSPGPQQVTLYGAGSASYQYISKLPPDSGPQYWTTSAGGSPTHVDYVGGGYCGAGLQGPISADGVPAGSSMQLPNGSYGSGGPSTSWTMGLDDSYDPSKSLLKYLVSPWNTL
ncbi:hypothetical protein PR048_028075 [Dryococelus australis]|uniref:Thyroid hormone receptor-associated protein complex subunit n=1 Tax=Dryococelus australis TaxID=614101 RepID=A0ABQ9GI79_9NEOP|nr:hypothetical protein PR048_028075 [Dryococelus australis]